MKMKSAVAVGLLAFSSLAAAASGKGVEGPLGDELFYNYLELNYAQSYLEDGRNSRVKSDAGYGAAGSIFLVDPLFLRASHQQADFSYSRAAQRVKEERDRSAFGLGVRLPLSYNFDLFVLGSYEYEKQERSPAPTGERREVEFEGAGGEIGVRGFISGFAELALSYNYRKLESTKSVQTLSRVKEELTEKTGILSLVVPVYDQLSLFGRVEFGTRETDFATHLDVDGELYMVGARINFRLPR